MVDGDVSHDSVTRFLAQEKYQSKKPVAESKIDGSRS
jgi:hypothetical protein